MGRFDGALDAPDASTLLPSATQSVQSSLYQRLRRTRGRRAGQVGWLLVRTAQPDHAAHADALAELSRIGAPGVRELAQIARGTATATTIAGRADSRDLAQAIVAALDAIAASLVSPGEVVTAGDLASYLAARARAT
jgi:hypothetical protein